MLNTSVNFNELPTVVAVVGSREFTRLDWVTRFVSSLKDGTIVVSGGARGVDTAAKEEALRQRKRLHYKEFAVENFEWKLIGKHAGHDRNGDIVRYVERNNGVVVIFAVKKGIDAKKGGSYDDVAWCERLGVPYYLYTV